LISPASPSSEPPDRAALATAPLEACSLTAFVLNFLRLRAVGFGGPIALAGYMHDLVEERRWLSKQDYVEGLALAQLAPGPLAAQLAIYLGWVKGGVLGATWVDEGEVRSPGLCAERITVGLWSKADSQVLFDDFKVEVLGPATTAGVEPSSGTP
jgi:Chromate transporter